MGSPPSPPAPTAPPTPALYLSPGATLITTSVGENGWANLGCQNAQWEISRVIFASYGLPDNTGLSARYGWCYAGGSQGVVERTCLGKDTCSVAASNGWFGDPCVGTYKRLTITAECTQKAKYPTWSSAGDTGTATVSCADGYIIDTDNGSTYGSGTCAFKGVPDAINALCQGSQKCSVPARPTIFGEDPCPGDVQARHAKG
ncbi:hypothetical protein H310_06846 [Aphanomyces invadans]|uniref:SUEL-type lectin domain-containing protein n=1 Tax=Aphanomyces invadans TaxID=157072 RepID=A0A024U4V0_9STRA|nr:hypothetical protein H310_06846 [Aphanomyces invadans]ETW01275.1 hypothetical protein H310_06846 [Aphanomyces invadans]|eukprot:XP_008870273.1 hypothetical protein H310_06846 [Aphanomyces invadans]